MREHRTHLQAQYRILVGLFMISQKFQRIWDGGGGGGSIYVGWVAACTCIITITITEAFNAHPL